jgi:hypothetical protein
MAFSLNLGFGLGYLTGWARLMIADANQTLFVAVILWVEGNVHV